MKTNIILYILIAAIGALQVSCSKQLNVLPTTQQVDGNIIVDLKSARTALNGVYYNFASSSAGFGGGPSVNWGQTIEIISSQLSNMLMAGEYSSTELSDHSYTPASYGAAFPWDYGYKLVNAANGFLKNLALTTSVTEADKKSMSAEAKFLRAYGTADLLFNFGQYDKEDSELGIILRTEMVTSGNISMPRNSVAECYALILEDLDDAIAGLPEMNTDIVYANIWCAKLLKARVMMQRGSAGDFEQVINLCNDIIINGPFSLQENTKDIFLSEALLSQEVMLGVRPYPNQTTKFYTYIYSTAVPSPLLKSWLVNDPRNNWMSNEMDVYGMVGDVLTKYYPGPVPYFEETSVTENCYALRLTEAYLLQAEAIAASNGNIEDAKDLLKTVLTHGGVVDFSEVDAIIDAQLLRERIIRETMINFVAEAGQDWLAVRRLPFARLQEWLPTITSKDRLILPIPLAEMTKNSAVAGKQNPGYGG